MLEFKLIGCFRYSSQDGYGEEHPIVFLNRHQESKEILRNTYHLSSNSHSGTGRTRHRSGSGERSPNSYNAYNLRNSTHLSQGLLREQVEESERRSIAQVNGEVRSRQKEGGSCHRSFSDALPHVPRNVKVNEPKFPAVDKVAQGQLKGNLLSTFLMSLCC